MDQTEAVKIEVAYDEIGFYWPKEFTNACQYLDI